MKRIQYKQAKYAPRPTFRTQRFGNLLSDTYQAEVDQSPDGSWSAWFFNLSNESRNDFKFGLKSMAAATRWANSKLRGVGV